MGKGQHRSGWKKASLSLYYQGKYDETIQCYNEAIRLDPEDAYAWYNKGLALESLGKTVAANEAYTKAEELGYTG